MDKQDPKTNTSTSQSDSTTQTGSTPQIDLATPEAELESGQRVLFRQGFFYVVVGATSALIELIVFQVLYRFGICSVEVSNVIAVVVSTSYNFTLNGRVTFKGVRNPVWALIKYLTLFAFNTTFTTLTISWLVGMGWDSLIAKLTTMCCVVLWNFVLYRKVIFK